MVSEHGSNIPVLPGESDLMRGTGGERADVLMGQGYEDMKMKIFFFGVGGGSGGGVKPCI